MHIRSGGDIEADVALSVVQRVVDWEEAHLGAGRFRTGGGIDTLENPEHLIVRDVNTCRHIHPYAQRVSDIQTLAVGRHIGGNSEDEIAETKIGQTEGGQPLPVRYIVCDFHTRCGCHGKFGVIFKINGIVHFVATIDKTFLFIITCGALDFVGVLGTIHLFGIAVHLSDTINSVGITGNTVHAEMSFTWIDSLFGHTAAYLIPAGKGIRGRAARCRGGTVDRRDLIAVGCFGGGGGNVHLHLTFLIP